MSDPQYPLQPGAWFPPEPPPRSSSVATAALKLTIGLAVGGVFFAMGWRTMAYVVWSLATVIGLVSMGSSAARGGLDRLFAGLGNALGAGLSWLLLAPTYVLGFSAVRALGRVSGADPLHLRDGDRQSFWLAADTPERKLRHVGALFATERPTPGGRGWLTALVMLAVLLVVAEVGLRVAGYGDPVLYRGDAVAGYYPAPNQVRHRSGGLVQTNAFGMRAPDFAEAKPADTFRVLMLGDSTLYGGSYIDQPDLYARRLEGLLTEAAKGRTVEILNMGVNGWGPYQKLGWVQRFGSFDADLAIICLPFGDLYRPFQGLGDRPYLPEGGGVWLALEEVVYHLTWRYRAATLKPDESRVRNTQAEDGAKTYLALARLLQSKGAEVMMEVLPTRPAALGEPSEREAEGVALLKKTLADAQVAVAWPAGLMKDGADHEPLYKDWVHLHRGGHARYADYLRGQVVSQSARFAAFSAPRSAHNGGHP